MAKKEKEPKEKKEKKPKKEKAPKEKKEKKPKKEKAPKAKKEKKGKKGADQEENGEGKKSGMGKRLVILLIVVLILLGGAGAAVYFLVIRPMQAQEEEEQQVVLEEVPKAFDMGHFGYFSHNGVDAGELLLDSVEIILAEDEVRIAELFLTESDVAKGYYISNPQIGWRRIFVSSSTSYYILDKGMPKQVSWSELISHISNGSALFEFEVTDNVITVMSETNPANVKPLVRNEE